MNGMFRNELRNGNGMTARSLDEVRQMQSLVLRYVGQLLHGCGDSTCTEATCATGRRNTSQKPVRAYTARSARAIAITLASGPKPTLRLCRRYRPERHVDADATVDGARDPASFLQQLTDTPSIQKVCLSPGADDSDIQFRKASRYSQEFYSHLREWHICMEAYLLRQDDCLPLPFILTDNATAANLLCHCIVWLAHSLPGATYEDWANVNAAVSMGLSTPDDSAQLDHDKRSKVIELLDSLDHGPSFQLLCRILEVMGRNEKRELDAFHNAKRRGESKGGNWYHQSLTFRVCRQLAVAKFHIARAPMLIWVKKIFLRYWDGDVMLRRGSIAAAALRFLHATAIYVHGDNVDDEKPNELRSYFPAIPARIDAAEVARTFMGLERPEESFHVLTFASVFTPHELAVYFRTINHLKMRRAHSEAEKAYSLRLRYPHVDLDSADDRLQWLEEHYLLLNISRQNVVQDAFDQLWQRRKGELLRPLRIRLGEKDEFEIGHDLGGVQIEFFNLLWRELLKEEAGMFTTDASTGISWLRPGSLQPLYMFELCGLLFALAIYNGITLPVTFPIAWYTSIASRGAAASRPMIYDRWPENARALNAILKEDIPGLECVVPLEANGLRLSVLSDEGVQSVFRGQEERMQLQVVEASRIVHHEANETNKPQTTNGNNTDTVTPEPVDISSIEYAWPGWCLTRATRAPSELTAAKKAGYVEFYATWLAWWSVAPQFAAFTTGFRTIINERSTSFLTKDSLRSIVEGTRHFDVEALKNVTQYEGYDPDSRYIRGFWRVVTNWPEEKQRQLLKFVTAIERMPSGGTQNFTFKIERLMPDDPERLPESSTCFRTLKLPKYPSVEVLDRKLNLALEYGLEGFGTG